MLAADPRECDGRRVLTLCGDDEEAKTAVAEFFDAAGFATIDLGGLIAGGRLQQVPGGAFPPSTSCRWRRPTEKGMARRPSQ